ncbi:MAG: FliM/FliN family flagellar motor switch protein [Opitutales bacterium]|nr:FliM/FliN family flagellar motor switch protein [Opitutales bacterium]
MPKQSPQPTFPKRRSRITPVIKADGTRLGGSEKVEVQPYTLGDRREVSLAVLEVLKEKHEDVLASLGPRLALFLRADVEFKLEDLTAAKYSRAVKEINPELHFNVFRADRATGSGFLGLNPLLALTAVNLLLGGKGETPKQPRLLTKIESDLSVDVANEFLDGWKSFTGKSMEFKPQAVAEEAARVESLIDAHTGVFLAKLKIKIKECEGDGFLVWPVHMIEPVIHQLEQTSTTNKKKAQSISSQWSPVYDRVPVRSDILVPAGRMSVEDFLALQPGSVIPLPAEVMEQAKMTLNGRPLFEGSFGMTPDHLALSLKQKL